MRFYKYSLLLTTLYSGIKVKAETEAKPSSVALSGTLPTVQMVPDLSKTTYPCFDLEGIIDCEGYEKFYIPQNGYYGYSTPAGPSINKYINEDLNGNTGFIEAICPNSGVEHDFSKIAYRYSVYCGRLMYAQVRWCKENDLNTRSHPELMLCKKTCEDYAYSITDYGKTICKNTDNSVAENITQNILDDWCSLFTDDAGCIEGTEREKKYCGYESASVSLEAQTFNPSNRCWGSPEIKKKLEEQASHEETTEVKIGGIRKKFYFIPAVMVLVALGTFYFWKRQNNLYKLGYIPGKENDKKVDDDYPITPSNVAPSRDYLSQDLAPKLEVPSIALVKRNSSFAVKSLDKSGAGAAAGSAATAAGTSSSNKNVVYMVAIYNYHSKMDDELMLHKGDRIRVEHQYDDGWGAGVNETTNNFGAFPLVCCSPNITSDSSSFPSRNASQKLRARKSNKSSISPLADKNNETTIRSPKLSE